MKVGTFLKIGQIIGALLMAAGVAAFLLGDAGRWMPLLLLFGGLVYGGCRLAAWLRQGDQ